MTKIPPKIINRLKYGKTNDGMVGCRVKPTGKNPNNKAWLTVMSNRGGDGRLNPSSLFFINYQVEYFELREDYDEVGNHYDWDYFLVKTETYYNIKNEEELEKLLLTWIDDFTLLTHVWDTNHPRY